MKIKSKIISYLLISVILAGLIVISCFSVFAETISIYVYGVNSSNYFALFNSNGQNIAYLTESSTTAQKTLLLNKNQVYSCYYVHFYGTRNERQWASLNLSDTNYTIINSTDINNPTLLYQTGEFHRIGGAITNNVGGYFKFTDSGYTLTFDSQGGSAITSESGVTDVTLGDSTGYFPQYIPTRLGYTFLGWSLTPGGTYVREVTLTDDTTVYANWTTSFNQVILSATQYHSYPDNTVAFELVSSFLFNYGNTSEIINFSKVVADENSLIFHQPGSDDDYYTLIFEDKTLNNNTRQTKSTKSSQNYDITLYHTLTDSSTETEIQFHSNSLPFNVTGLMAVTDFQEIYQRTGWLLTDLSVPITYFSENSVQLYSEPNISSSAPTRYFVSNNDQRIYFYPQSSTSYRINNAIITYIGQQGQIQITLPIYQYQSSAFYYFDLPTYYANQCIIEFDFKYLYKCALSISQYPSYVINIYNGNQHITGNSTFYYDEEAGINLRFDLSYPYVNVDVFLQDLVEPPLIPTITYDYTLSSTILNPDATDGQAMMRIYVKANPSADCELIINPRYITDYTIVERNPIVSINSEGEMSWIIDTENAWDDTMSAIDYAQITANIPQVFNGILDGVYGLTGLSMIVTLLLVIGFTSWIIRNY